MKPQSILLKSILWLGTLAMLAFVNCAQAKVSCTISSAGFSTAYGSALSVTAANFTVTCTANTFGGSATYQVAVNNGANFSGTQNRAALAGNYLNYNLTSDSGCLTAWNGTTYIPATAYTASLAANGTDIKTYSYYGCVPAGLTVPATGSYTDTVNMSFVPGGTSFTSGIFPVSIYAPATCSLTTAPGNISFNYTSLGDAAAASTSFATTCSNLLSYTMALDATSGTIVGVDYTLALSASSSTGTGGPQTFTINGNVPSGQSGTCAAATCTGTQTRTLTISY
jgi:spore coat protein U-like protein